MPDQNSENIGGADLMAQYRFLQVGTVFLKNHSIFSIEITLAESLDWEKTIYAFVIKDEIVRIGSSKEKFKKRINSWQRDVTRAIHNINGLGPVKTPTPEDEAKEWVHLLTEYKEGKVFAREAAFVTTPVGTFRAYMDEESVLINRYRPRLNRHTNR